MHAAYFVDEREVTCRVIETKGPTGVATLSSLQEPVPREPLVGQYRCSWDSEPA